MRRDHLVLAPEHEHATPEMYPRLWNIPAGMMYDAIIRAEVPAPPEYVTIPMPTGPRDERALAMVGQVSQWNMLWEAAQFRRRFFSEEDLPAELSKVADHGDVNVVFIPRTRSRYYEYAPVFHLLPRTTLDRHGLPLLSGGQWPFLAEWTSVDPTCRVTSSPDCPGRGRPRSGAV